jgi:hypothetical protein
MQKYKTNGEKIWDLIRKNKKGITARQISKHLNNYDIQRIYYYLRKLSSDPVDEKFRLIKLKSKKSPDNTHSKKEINKYRIVKEN